MKRGNGLHPAQVSVLYALRHQLVARYSELRRTTSLESDVFKFHLRTLRRLKFIDKLDDGTYALTAMGKEFANRLDTETGTEVLQPKSSMLLVVRAQKAGVWYYLAHQRKRQPFYDFWGIASAPLPRGVPIIEAAANETKKQMGIDAAFTPVGIQRSIDTDENGTILEDKTFTIMLAEIDTSPTPHEWHGGASEWLTREQLLAKTPLFPTTEETLKSIETQRFFVELTPTYKDKEY